jgi:hypothetical protein
MAIYLAPEKSREEIGLSVRKLLFSILYFSLRYNVQSMVVQRLLVKDHLKFE